MKKTEEIIRRFCDWIVGELKDALEAGEMT